MSIKILTLKEAEITQDRCRIYGEVCEMLVGKAKADYFCDNSGDFIPRGEECAAVMVLTSTNHPNYEHQKNMLKEYILEGKK